MLPNTLEREIWRYLEDEERYFLERCWLRGMKITEDTKEKALEDFTDEDLEKEPMSLQSVANFAAKTGWIAALEYLIPITDPRQTVTSTALGGQVPALKLLKKVGLKYPTRKVIMKHLHSFLEDANTVSGSCLHGCGSIFLRKNDESGVFMSWKQLREKGFLILFKS